MNGSATTHIVAGSKNPLPLGMGSVKLYCYSMLASHTMKEGEKFESVKRKYVIVMIVDGDPLKLDLPVSHNSLHNDETGVKIDAGLAIIYVDATRYDEDTEVGRLMKDFHQKKADGFNQIF